MKTSIIYAVIAINVEHPEDMAVEDVAEIVGNEMSYECTYSDEHIIIKETNVMEVTADWR